MRAALLKELGGIPEVQEVPEPEAKDQMQTVQVTAAALNPVDLSMATGEWYGNRPQPPYIPGREGVGQLPDGRRIWFLAPGTFAQQCAVCNARSVQLPEGLDDALAACIGIAGLAAWLALQWRAKVQPGETVLVLGSSGPVGTIAIQAAKLMGAGRVVAAARNQERLDSALLLGADATVNLAQVEDLADAFRQATQGGADVTIDPLWGEPGAAAAAAAAKGGRLIQLGQSAGAQATLTSAAVRGNMLSILGHSNFDVPFKDQAAAYSEIAEHAAAGSLKIDYDTYPLDRIDEAWKLQQKGPYKKLVIVPSH